MGPVRKGKKKRHLTVAIATVYSQDLPNKGFYVSQVCLFKVHITGL